MGNWRENRLLGGDKMDYWQVKQKQSLPLEAKIVMSQQRIREWYDHFNGRVYVSFSGGKDSTVLLDLVREIYPRVPAVFADTGLEFPEIRDFVKETDNVTWITPSMSFKKVLEVYGYPVVSKEQAKYIYEVRNTKSEKLRNKRLYGQLSKTGTLTGAISKKWQYLIGSDIKISERCCDIMKKRPFAKYEKETGRVGILGVMAGEGSQRKETLSIHGCNAFDLKRPQSRPLTFWLEEDIWSYINKKSLSFSKIYDLGYPRTGCMFCMFGVHLEKEPNRFQLMKKTHPKQYKYCMEKLGLNKILDILNVSYQ